MNLNTFLEQNTHWTQLENTLIGKFTFDGFSEVSAAVQESMQLASELNHHPEVTFGFNTLKIVLTTHDAGSSITDLDIEFAEKFTQKIL
jgi:4a-hydroxytetrahydrobiopterin dehydratase